MTDFLAKLALFSYVKSFVNVPTRFHILLGKYQLNFFAVIVLAQYLHKNFVLKTAQKTTREAILVREMGSW